MPTTITDRLDGLTTSVAVKPPCAAVASSNITLADLQTIGSVTVIAGDRVLCVGQTDATENGIYIADTGDWTRAKDFDGTRDAVQGTLVLVRNQFTEGAIYELTTENPIVFGISELTFFLHDDPNITYDQTQAEIDAGVVPLNDAWPEGWVPRYGAVGDGSVETAFVQAALDVGMQGVEVVFPKNKTYVVNQLDIAPGMSIRGHGATSVLKLAPNQPRFQRILTTEDNLWDSASDSEPITIDHMCFDGDYLNQGAFTNFEKEHQQQIGLFADNLQEGRLRAIVTRCYFKNSCSDGIITFYNTDVTVSNCYFDNCFRSSVAMTGGNAILRISNCRGVGSLYPSRFQIEVDSAGFGSSKRADLVMTNCDWNGGLDIAVDGGSIIQIDDTIFRSTTECITNLDGNSTGLNTLFTATNCYFKIGSNSSNTHRFLKYGHSKFIGCTFEYVNNTSHANLIQPGGRTGMSITFDDCTFIGDSSYHTTATVAVSTATWASGLLTVNTGAAHGLVANDYVELASFTSDVNGLYRVTAAADSDTITVPFPRDPGAVTVGSGTTRKRSALNALSSSADISTNQNVISVINCHFDEKVDCAFDMQQGGTLIMRGNHVAAGLLYDAGSAAAGGFIFDVRIGQYTFGTKHRQMCHIIGSVAGCILRHEETYVPVDRAGFTRTSNLTGMTVLGSRILYGTGAALSTDAGLIGDRYRRSPPVAATASQYACTVSGQSGASTTWVVETTLA